MNRTSPWPICIYCGRHHDPSNTKCIKIHFLLPVMILLALPLVAHGQERSVYATNPAVHCGDKQEPIAPIIKPPRYDWSFARDPKFYAGVTFSFAVTAYDISTSHGPERTRLLRGSNGELSKAKYYGLTAITNAGFLPLDLMRNHCWRYASLFGRVALAAWRWNGARHNR